MSSFKVLAICVVALSALPAHSGHAQDSSSSGAAPAGTRDPGDPKVAVPPTTYVSAFRRYRPNVEAEVGAWRELNDQVRRIGGWRVYGREALAERDAADNATSPQPNGQTSAPSRGHKH